MKAFSFLFCHSQLLETVQKTYEIDKEQLQKKLTTATEELTKSRTAAGKFFIFHNHELITKIGIDFYRRRVKWPKVAVKKCQNILFSKQSSPFDVKLLPFV